MNLKVKLPSGDVNVPVEPNSTPGHLKENLKYSIRLPPKFIKLTCEGKELEDIKPLSGPPNNLVDGSVVVAQPKEGAEVEAAEAAAAAEAEQRRSAQPTMIKKEEPAKPKKIRKDTVRPVLEEKDVVKKETLAPGYQAWAPKFHEGKHAKRHMAFLKLESGGDEKKCYPEQDQESLALALGDPQTSPVWTAAVCQMEIGEKAVFTMNRKAVDFDPEGLNPTDSCSSWTIELLNIVDVLDINEDYSKLLQVADKGSSQRGEDLDTVAVHWRYRRWSAEGGFCIGSSRERIAIMPGYGLVPIEDLNAPPVQCSLGEGQMEAVEALAKHAGPGSKGHVYLKSDAMKGNRPAGCVVLDVEIVAIQKSGGPGAPDWNGWQSVVQEREIGDNWLEEADARRKNLETFETMRKSTTDSKDAESHVAGQVQAYAKNAGRRYRRALEWAEKDPNQDKKMKTEQLILKMRMAKASFLVHMRFGENPGEATEEEKKAIAEARTLLAGVLTVAEEMKSKEMVYECQKLTLQACIQAEDIPEAKSVLDKLQALRPGDEDLQSDGARLNRMEKNVQLKQGSNEIETLQQDLRDANEAKDFEKGKEKLERILELMKKGEVTYATVTKLKVGKDVGNAMKLGNPDLAGFARKVVGEIQALAQRNSLGL